MWHDCCQPVTAQDLRSNVGTCMLAETCLQLLQPALHVGCSPQPTGVAISKVGTVQSWAMLAVATGLWGSTTGVDCALWSGHTIMGMASLVVQQTSCFLLRSDRDCGSPVNCCSQCLTLMAQGPSLSWPLLTQKPEIILCARQVFPSHLLLPSLRAAINHTCRLCQSLQPAPE